MEKIVFITTTSPNKPEGFNQLIRSLIFNNWEYHVIEHAWKGFGDKILETYQFLKNHPEIDKFIYSDAWDSFCFASPEEVLGKMLNWDEIIFSAECACYPHPELADKYPSCLTPWKYLNGGSWICTNKRFCEMVEHHGTTSDENDQVYSTRVFLFHNDGRIKLDYSCSIFQTLAFAGPDDFGTYLHYKNDQEYHRIVNNRTSTLPCFVHGNGRTPMDHIYNLIK